MKLTLKPVAKVVVLLAAVAVSGCAGSLTEPLFQQNGASASTNLGGTFAAVSTQQYTFIHFGNGSIGKANPLDENLALAAWSNRQVILTRMSTAGASTALAVWRTMASHRSMAPLTGYLVKLGCSTSPVANAGFSTTMGTTWIDPGTDKVKGWQQTATFATSVLPVTCANTRYTAAWVVGQQSGALNVSTLRVVYRDMKDKSGLFEEILVSRDGKTAGPARCALADCWFRSAQGAASDVAPGVGQAFERIIKDEGGRPVEGVLRRLLDASQNATTGVPRMFAVWHVLARVGTLEEDAPFVVTALKPDQKVGPKPHDNFFERFLRNVDKSYDDLQPRLPQLIFDAAVAYLNGAKPAPHSGAEKVPAGVIVN